MSLYLHRYILSLYSGIVLQYLYKLNSIKNHSSKKMYKMYLILISAAFNWLSLPTISTYNIMFEALSQHTSILYLFCVICAVGMLQRACVYSVCLRSFGFTRTMHHTIIVKSEARAFLMFTHWCALCDIIIQIIV